MDRERFSMLLLEPGEIYFEDYSTIWLSYDSSSKTLKENSSGRLKLCSKSLVFETQNRVKPLIKIQFKECYSIAQWEVPVTINKDNIIVVKCKQYAEMLEGNVIAPYKFKSEDAEFLFLLHYASVNDCVQQMNQLIRASSLHACEQNSMIATISHSRYSRIKFDPLWLDDIYDPILIEINADRVTPLVQNPGKVVLTSKTLFFQPCNNVEPYPVVRIAINVIKKIFKRRFLLRHIGLEIYNALQCDVPHIYLSMKSQDDRDRLHQLLMQQSDLRLDNVEQNEMTMQWQNGVISNYDYILYLNSLADRTKNDLTQYPVFPWIISDYTSPQLNLEDPSVYRDLSKPVGALNPERLQRLKDRYDEMAPPRFLYGSHYSAPGLVLFYLVRKCPHFMLCLQNGRFDHPDRMFNILADVYRNCLNNMSDFKELIPEFYDLDNNGDFLMNQFGIQFGHRHDGTKVDNVVIPPWAKSPQHLIETLRKALESDIVSQNLHHWIDLIFGFKQRGKEAERANNVFFHLCYEGAVNLDDIADMNEKHALEVQIMEFGQIPKQIFKKPHPRRILQYIKRSLSLSQQVEDDDEDSPRSPVSCEVKSLKHFLSFHSHREGVNCVIVSEDNKRVISLGKDGLLKVYCIETERQTRSVSIGTMALSCCVQMDHNTLVLGSWDNSIILYDLEYGRVVSSFAAHSDSVTCLLWSPEDGVLISGGRDCVVRVWGSLSSLFKGTFRPVQGLQGVLDHDSRISCLAFNKNTNLLLCGTEDGELMLWTMKAKPANLQSLPPHKGAVTGVCFISDNKRIVTCSTDGELRVTDVSINVAVYSKMLSEGISSLCYNESVLLYLGGSGGTLFLWNLQTVAQVTQIKAHQASINTIAIGKSNSFVVTGGEDHHVKVWKIEY